MMKKKVYELIKLEHLEQMNDGEVVFLSSLVELRDHSLSRYQTRNVQILSMGN
jgi:hypothetical protein